MIQTLPQYMILLKARINKSRYRRVPTEDTFEETIIFEPEQTNNIADKNASDSSNNDMLGKEKKIPTPSKEQLDSLYKRIVAQKESARAQKVADDNKNLYARIKEQIEKEELKRAEQEQIKQQARIKEAADEYAQLEINKIEEMLEQIRQTPVIENVIDARTSTSQQESRQAHFPSRKEIGQFTQRILKPVIQNLSRELITK